MIRSRRLCFLLVLLAPAAAFAQPEHLPEYMRDSLQAFIERMHADTTRQAVVASPSEYVLVWTDHCDGGPSWITRGDGTQTLASFMSGDDGKTGVGYFGDGFSSGPLFFGSRYALIDVELPTGLVRYTRWYFERRDR